ncbi:hypothetical protein Tco_0602381, partial [Tanacetum coccineum]
CLKLKTELLNKKDFVEKEIYDKLENSVSNQSAPSFDQLFELNELKAQSQKKDTVIKKLKKRIKSLSGKQNENKIKKDLEEIETINTELDHRVTKLIAENKHLKQTYKKLYDSIKLARIRSKEQCDDLINQVHLKSVEISYLNASLQEKSLVITALKDDLRKLKGKALVDNDVTKHPIKHTQEEANVLRDIVEHVKSQYPLDQYLESACRYAKLVQELLTNISKTCPSINNANGKLVAVTPKNKDKSVRFTKPVTSSGNTITKAISTSNLVSNKPMLSSAGVKPSTSTSGSQPSSNTKKDKIRITTTTEVPIRKPTALENETPKPVVTLVYSRKPMKSKTNVPISKSKVLKYVSAIKKESSSSWGSIVSDVPSSSLSECRLSKLFFDWKCYDLKGLLYGRTWTQLILRWAICDSNLEVAFHQHTCFIRNLEGVDLLTRSRGNNLYTLSLGNMMASSPICLLSMASKTKACLWQKDYLCSAFAMGK